MIAERDHVLDQADRDERPVWQSVHVPATSDRIVLIIPDLGDPNKPFPNLVRRKQDDKIVWTAQLAEIPWGDLPDSYIDVRWEGQALIATSFYGFFFQAEDGIRDLTVTGVQTCALPIFRRGSCCPSGRRGTGRPETSPRRSSSGPCSGEPAGGCSARRRTSAACGSAGRTPRSRRSEERGVGKEGRSRWSPYH